jgi:UDP-N-acetyl-D-mannosaminuronic acid transferase (WecB/TagA/CpsF family)
MTFVEYEDGRIVNAATIRQLNPRRSNRIDYTDGTHELLSEADAERVKGALSGRAPEPAKGAETAPRKIRKTK